MFQTELSTGEFRRWVVLLAAVSAVVAMVVSPARAASLSAGVAARSITSDTPTATVNDPLYAKALVVDDGRTKIAIISLDLGGASASLVSEIRRRLRQELGIDESGVLVGASHNHHVQGQTVKNLAGNMAWLMKKLVD